MRIKQLPRLVAAFVPVRSSLVAIAIPAAHASGVTRTWTRGDGTSFSNAGNWDIGVPQNGDNIVFGTGDLTTSGIHQINNNIAGLSIGSISYTGFELVAAHPIIAVLFSGLAAAGMVVIAKRGGFARR